MADLSITAANVLQGTGATTKNGTAGATITAGQVLYKDAADSNKLKLADANGAAALRVVAGIALHGAATGQPIAYLTAGPDFVPGATLVLNEVYVLSATPGGMMPDADLGTGHYATVLGIAKSTTVMNCSGFTSTGAARP